MTTAERLDEIAEILSCACAVGKVRTMPAI
jgi:hypothetical protein